MEYLDYYDKQDNYLGYASRKEIHEKGLWHKTVHCWLYDVTGNVYFQIRADTNKFYTTASGHVKKDETIKDAFHREIKEEIGLDIDTQNALLIGIIPWQMKKVHDDGRITKDYAKANVYLNLYDGDTTKFNFDNDEVKGIVKVNAQETLTLLKQEQGTIPATIITQKRGKILINNQDIAFSDFLVMPNENAYTKYSDILNKIIEITNK